jgi:hypothetical protein
MEDAMENPIKEALKQLISAVITSPSADQSLMSAASRALDTLKKEGK